MPQFGANHAEGRCANRGAVSRGAFCGLAALFGANHAETCPGPARRSVATLEICGGDSDGYGPAPLPARRRWLVLPLLAICSALGALTFGALGLIGDSETNATDQAITEGNIDIGLSSGTTATLSNAAPGDTFYKWLSVSNSGSLHARVAVEVAVPPDVPGDNEDLLLGQWIIADAQWSVLSGACAASFNPTGPSMWTESATFVQLIGNAAPGADTNDQQVNAAASSGVCTSYHVPTTAPASVAQGVVDLSLKFEAEQVKNNP